MYRIEDRVAAIKDLQKMLGVNRTGNYDKATVSAVKKVQEKYSVEKTTAVDYKTFLLIVKDYRDSKKRVWKGDFLFNPGFPYKKDDMGENVRRINEALSIVLSSYRYSDTLPRGAYLGEDSVAGVRFLQKLFGMDDNGMIDAELMNRILAEIEGIEIKEQYR